MHRHRQGRGTLRSPPGDFPHFWSICHFQFNLDKHLPLPCTVLGTLYCNRQLMSLSPPRFILSLCPFIKHTVSTCSVPGTGDTENGRDTVPALTELTVWWGDRHTDSHKHSVVGLHVHSLPCLKEDRSALRWLQNLQTPQMSHRWALLCTSPAVFSPRTWGWGGKRGSRVSGEKPG